MVSCFYETKAPVQLQWLTVNKEVRVSNFLYCCCLFPVIKDSCKKQHFYFLFLLLNIFLPPYFFHLLLLLLLLVLLFFSLSLSSLQFFKSYKMLPTVSLFVCNLFRFLLGIGRLRFDSHSSRLHSISVCCSFFFFFSVWRPCTMCRPRRVKIPTTSSKSCAAPSWAKESPSNRKGTSTFDFQSHSFIRNRSPSHFIRSPRFSWNGIIKPKFS